MKKNYFKNLMQVSLLLGAAFVISSCDDVIGQEDNPVASYVQWEAKTPKSIELTLGIAGMETDTVKAVAVSSVVIVYESENPEIAKVDPVTGVITAVGVGETNIKAVVTGASSAGQSVFIPEEIKIPVVVKDGKAKLTRTVDQVDEYTVNADSVIDLKKLFTAYPEVGTENENSQITFTLLGKNNKTAAGGNSTNIAFITANDELKIQKNGYGNIIDYWVGKDAKKVGTDISDTVYVAAKISGAGTKPAFNYKDAKATEDTIMFVINKSIAFINKDGKREILTADKYKEVDLSANSELKAGTYYVTDSYTTWTSYPYPSLAIKGNVDLIFKNTIDAGFGNIDDQTDGNAALNIFGEAIPAGTAKYAAWTPVVNSENYPNAITNFKEINLYAGTLNVNGLMKNVKDVNVFKSTTLNANSGLSLTGKLTINDGAVNAYRYDSDLETGFAVIGDVVLNKGSFYAENTEYRAVKGSLTAGEGLEFVESNTPAVATSWTKIEGTTSNAKGIKSQAKK
jgi:hypothetical protein